MVELELLMVRDVEEERCDEVRDVGGSLSLSQKWKGQETAHNRSRSCRRGEHTREM